LPEPHAESASAATASILLAMGGALYLKRGDCTAVVTREVRQPSEREPSFP
jgi:hypothetical protein